MKIHNDLALRAVLAAFTNIMDAASASATVNDLPSGISVPIGAPATVSAHEEDLARQVGASLG